MPPKKIVATHPSIDAIKFSKDKIKFAGETVARIVDTGGRHSVQMAEKLQSEKIELPEIDSEYVKLSVYFYLLTMN